MAYIGTDKGVRLIAPKLIDVEVLLGYPRNSRTHSPAQVDAICANMQRVGFTNPLLIADNVILAGHGRLLAAKKLGLSRVPCIDLSHLSEAERKAQVIWDNRSAEVGSSWDLEMLKAETDALRAEGFDIEEMTGWDEGDLSDLLAGLGDDPSAGGSGGGGGNPDDIPPPEKHVISVVGDVWLCGPHKVGCGDSCDLAAWDRLLGGDMVDVVWTDPPYNVDQAAKNKRLDAYDGMNRSRSGAVENDAMKPAEFKAFLSRAFAVLFELMRPGAPIYVAHADVEGLTFRETFTGAGFKQQTCLVWAKNHFSIGRWDYQAKHEPILYGWKPGAAHAWYGGRKQTSVLDFVGGDDASPFSRLPDGRVSIRFGDDAITLPADTPVEVAPGTVFFEPKPQRSDLHPTTKPVALVERMLKNSAKPGHVVIDGFGGSGTTLIAADRLGLRARLMELSPDHCDTIVRRWQNLTGGTATHAVTGQKFGEAVCLENNFMGVESGLSTSTDGEPF